MAKEVKPKDEAEQAEPPVDDSNVSTHQRYLNSLLSEEQPVPVFGASVNPRDNDAFDQGGYVGTDPIYQNHANDTEAPLAAEGGADELAEKAYFESVRGEAKQPGEQLKELYGKASNTSDK